MRCVPEAVNQLFPELDLSAFEARNCGYSLADIQRMIPEDFSAWPIYVNHQKVLNFDLIKILPKTVNQIPLFIATSKHCIFALWTPSEIQIFDRSEHFKQDADEYFRRNKIFQVFGIVRYQDYKLLEI